MNQITTHDPLANQINAEYAAARRSARDTWMHVLKCGDLLIEAKEKYGEHGTWKQWLHDNCGQISYRTAALYMQLAGGREKIEAASGALTELTLNEAAKLISPPKTRPEIYTVKGDSRVWKKDADPAWKPKTYLEAEEEIAKQSPPLALRAPSRPTVKDDGGALKDASLKNYSVMSDAKFDAEFVDAWNKADAKCKEGEALIKEGEEIQLAAHKADLIDAIEKNKRNSWSAMQVRLYLEKELCKHLTPEEQKVRWFQALGLYWALFCCFLEDASPGAIQMYDLHKGILKRVIQACEAAETEATTTAEAGTPTEAPAPAETAATPAPDVQHRHRRKSRASPSASARSRRRTPSLRSAWKLARSA